MDARICFVIQIQINLKLMGIKEYFMLLLLGIALWFLVVVPTWTRSSRMALHCWEGTNSITLLLPLRFCYYLQQQVCCPLFTPAGEDGSVCGGEGSCQVCGVTLRDSVWRLKNKRIDLVSDWTLNKLWLWDQACRICRELLVYSYQNIFCLTCIGSWKWKVCSW